MLREQRKIVFGSCLGKCSQVKRLHLDEGVNQYVLEATRHISWHERLDLIGFDD